MSGNAQVKEFSAERQYRLRQSGALSDGWSGKNGAGSALGLVPDSSGVTNAEILQAIQDLAQVAGAGAGLSGGARAEIPEDESQDVRMEIAMMVRAIARAKAELAAIKHPDSDDDRIHAASNELDAIVEATESATNQILEANEAIETEINAIAKTHHDDEQVMLLVDKIADQSIRILESCNFQDITGQRVTKVVKTIRFIEERILAMIDIWGVQAFAELPVPDVSVGKDGDDLMNGPQLGNSGISQDEIDALFD